MSEFMQWITDLFHAISNKKTFSLFTHTPIFQRLKDLCASFYIENIKNSNRSCYTISNVDALNGAVVSELSLQNIVDEFDTH